MLFLSYLELNFKTWREDLERYKIRILEDYEVLGKAKESNVLPVTSCSAGKGVNGVPSQLYTGKSNIRFYSWCEDNLLEYGVLSDRYGLLLWNEEAEVYDVHPSSLTKQKFRKLGSEIYFKMESISCDQFLFFGLPPVSCRPYFKMMLVAGMKIFYTTKLPKE